MGVVQSTSSVDFFGIEIIGDWYAILPVDTVERTQLVFVQVKRG